MWCWLCLLRKQPQHSHHVRGACTCWWPWSLEQFSLRDHWMPNLSFCCRHKKQVLTPKNIWFADTVLSLPPPVLTCRHGSNVMIVISIMRALFSIESPCGHHSVEHHKTLLEMCCYCVDVHFSRYCQTLGCWVHQSIQMMSATLLKWIVANICSLPFPDHSNMCMTWFALWPYMKWSDCNMCHLDEPAASISHVCNMI